MRVGVEGFVRTRKESLVVKKLVPVYDPEVGKLRIERDVIRSPLRGRKKKREKKHIFDVINHQKWP